MTGWTSVMTTNAGCRHIASSERRVEQRGLERDGAHLASSSVRPTWRRYTSSSDGLVTVAATTGTPADSSAASTSRIARAPCVGPRPQGPALLGQSWSAGSPPALGAHRARRRPRRARRRPVAAQLALELVRRALGDHPAAVDDGQPVGEMVGLLQVVRRQQDGHARPRPPAGRSRPTAPTRDSGSSPVVGSSRKSTEGRFTRPRRCRACGPCLRCRSGSAGRRPAGRSNRSSSSAARADARRARTARRCGRPARCSRGRSSSGPRWSSAGPGRSPDALLAGRGRRRARRRCACPVSARDRVVRILTVVDLPAPLGPSRPKTSPARTVRSRPSRARIGGAPRPAG